MDTPIDRVMKTYGMMVSLTLEEQEDVRARLEQFLQQQTGTANDLAVAGLKFLRGDRPLRHAPRRKAVA